MNESAISWAGSVTGSTIRDWEELVGGMTSTMLALTDDDGRASVLRLMTEEPWRSHGAALTRREQAAQQALEATRIPAPVSLALDAGGTDTGVSAHLMSRLAGAPTAHVDADRLVAMAEMLAAIHDVRPAVPFRAYETWAWEAKWVAPAWSRQPASWQRAFEILADGAPDHTSTFLHRDFSHRNLLWTEDAISGVVDWVETSTGPAWLDAGHAATNLAVAFGRDAATGFLEAYAATTGSAPDVHWLIMDAVGFLPPSGREPMFGSAPELARLDGWLCEVVACIATRPRD